MDWLHRIAHPGTVEAPAPAKAPPEAAESAAPGVTALLQRVSEDRSHSVLDLGPAVDATLQVYSRFARWIRFADLLGEGGWTRAGEQVGGFSRSLPANAEHPYDLIFAWDVLDRLFPEDRPHLMEALAPLAAPGAHMHLVLRAEDSLARPLRFTLTDTNRLRFEPITAAPLPRSRPLPAELMRVLAPFQVVHAFTLRAGLREYVAVKPAS